MASVQRPLIAACLALAAGLGIIGGPAGTARATTFDVTRFDDPTPDGCLPGDCSLREAILDANASAGPDTLYLPAGTYALTLAGMSEDAAATGDLDILGDLSLAGQGGRAIVDAGLLGDRVFHVVGGSGLPVVSITNLTLAGGLEHRGGGLYNLGGSVTLTNSSVSGNNVSNEGGGIYNAGGTLTITDSTISDNACDPGGYGGGLFNTAGLMTVTGSILDNNSGGGLSNQEGGTLILSRVTVSNNVNLSSGGGGVINVGGTVEVSDSLITGNSAPGGGGLLNSSSYTGLTGRLTLTNSTVSNNIADSDTIQSQGGGLWNQADDGDAQLTLINTSVSGNLAVDSAQGIDRGGGLYNRGSATGVATVRLVDSAVSGNTAQEGGGLYNDLGSVELTNSLISNNFAELNGGGVYSNMGAVTLTGSTIEGNEAVTYNGGGLLNYGDPVFAGTLTLTDSLVTANSAGQYGGGIMNGFGTVTLLNSTVSNNSATAKGGGVYHSGTMTVSHSTISGNSAADGGGFDSGGSNTLLTLNNVTVSGNSATNGGALYNEFSGTVNLNSVTISANTTTTGGAIRSTSGTITAANSIIATQTLGADCASTLTSAGYNLESGTSCGLTGTGDRQNTNPSLLPLAVYGGGTATHALLGRSPAIDAGDPAGCQADLDGDGIRETTLTTDQRGWDRADMPGVGNAPPDQVCDIGAHEYMPRLLNGSFESDRDANGIPDAWFGRNLGVSDGQQCTVSSHSGACLFRLVANGTKKSVHQNVGQAGLAGDSYTLSVWNSTAFAMGGTVVARLAFNYTDGTTGRFDVPLPQGTHGWLQSTLVATAAQDYGSLSVAVVSTLIGGAMNVDDITLLQN